MVGRQVDKVTLFPLKRGSKCGKMDKKEAPGQRQLFRARLKSLDKREGKADNKGKQGGDDGECVNIQAISAGKSMKRYERI